MEIVEDHDGDTYRAVYAVRFAGRVYVLHSFQKKSKSGIATPKAETNLINARLKRAEEEHRVWLNRQRGRKRMPKAIEVEEGSGNVFADLGLPNPEERLAKAGLAFRIAGVIRARRLTQAKAARILKIDQPTIPRLLHGQLCGFSTERLMQFLTLLGRDVEIVIKPTPRSRRQGRLRVVAASKS